MVKQILLGFAALALSVAASAQTFPKPPDVAAYSAVTPSWPTGSNAVAFKGPSDTAPTAGLADIPSANPSQLKYTGGTVFCNSGEGDCPEAKFRSHLEITHVLFDDPIRNYGKPGTSHCHLFFGNRAVTGYSTFASLRGRAQKYSRAGGGGLNGTGYWMPCMEWPNAFGDGKTYVPLPSTITLYYAEEPANSAKLHPIPLGLRYVGGFNMDDGGAYFDTILAAANTAAGSSRYTRDSSGNSNTTWGRHRITCTSSVGAEIPRTNNVGEVRHFVNSDGSDPWGGNCVSGSSLQFIFVGPSCWDGVNLWSPGGYKHIVPLLWDTVSSTYVCPQNYYRLPELQLNFSYKHTGFAAFSKWRLSSDMHAIGANTNTVAGKTVRRGETFHTDWFGAWDKTAFDSWLNFCIGVKGQTPHQCDSGTISATESLITNNHSNPQTGKNPQVQFVFNRPNAVAADMTLLPASATNTGSTLHVHGQ